MTVIGTPRSYFKKFLFKVEVEGVSFAGFQKCSPIEMETAIIEQWEGGVIAADTSPGRVKTSIVTLDRGATKDLDLWTWAKLVSNIAANSGAVDDQYKRSVDVIALDRDGTELRRWTLHKAWPTKFSAGDWDNTADANVIETLGLTYKWFDPTDDKAA